MKQLHVTDTRLPRQAKVRLRGVSNRQVPAALPCRPSGRHRFQHYHRQNGGESVHLLDLWHWSHRGSNHIVPSREKAGSLPWPHPRHMLRGGVATKKLADPPGLREGEPSCR